VKLGACRHCGAELVQGAYGCVMCGHLVDEVPVADTSARHPTQLGTRAKDALLDGQWRLIEPLGRGRRATVWLAQDVSFDRKVALKLLDEALAKDAAEVGRFERDARRLAGLEHPNIAGVLALGTSDGVPFVVMKRAEGRSLAEHVHTRGDRLEAAEAAHVVRQLCEAFEAVHAAGAPQGGLLARHVFVAADGRVTLLDVRADAQPASPQTALIDRVHAIAPEVLRAQAPSFRSDVFALGCLLWELVSGAPPDRGALSEVLAGRPQPVRPLTGVPDGLRDAVMRAVDENPSSRFASAAELGAAIGPFARFEPPPPAADQAKTRLAVDVPAAAAVDGPTDKQVGPPAPLRRRTRDDVAAQITPVEAPTAPQDVPPALARRRTRDDVAAQAAPPVEPTRPLSLLDEGDVVPGERDRSTRAFDPTQLELERERVARARPLTPLERRRRWGLVVAGALSALLFLALSFDRRGERGPPLPEKIAGLDPTRPPVEEPVASAPTSDDIKERIETFERVHDETAALKEGRKVRGAARVGRRVTDYPMLDARQKPMSELEVRVLLNGEKTEADVHVDGKLIGPSPIFMPVTPGTHRVGVERRPVTADDVPIAVPAGKSVRVEIELAPLVDPPR
jgi:hypothetical protein